MASVSAFSRATVLMNSSQQHGDDLVFRVCGYGVRGLGLGFRGGTPDEFIQQHGDDDIHEHDPDY